MSVRHPHVDRPRLVRLAALAVLAAAAVAAPARAQMGVGAIGDVFRPDYVAADLETLVAALALDEQQTPIVTAMLEEHETMHRERVAAVREALAALRPEPTVTPESRAERRELARALREIRDALREANQAGDEAGAARLRRELDDVRAAMAELRPAPPTGEALAAIVDETLRLTDAWIAERDARSGQLVEDLEALLTDAQRERWPDVERTLRRERLLAEGRFGGEAIDLLRLVDDLELPAEAAAALAAERAAYARELDDALRRRQATMDTSRRGVLRAMRDGDPALADAAVDAESRARADVCAVHERFAERMADALPDEPGRALLEAWRLAAYPRVYRPTRLAEAFDAALAIEDLDEAVRAEIASLRTSYESDLEPMNAMLADAVRAHESAQAKARMRRMLAMFAGERAGRAEDPTGEAFARRRALDEGYRGRLEALLSAEQIAALPPAVPTLAPDALRPAGPEDRIDAARSRARLVERYDLDGDGDLSAEEREAALDDGLGHEEIDAILRADVRAGAER